VGAWTVRSVLGRRWWDNNSIDVRLLIDPDEKQVNRNTALRFAARGRIRKLRGLHAKIYVVDDRVLLTSANLTFAGFAKRHEAGAILTGMAASSAIALFSSWWSSAADFSIADVLRLPRTKLHVAGEDDVPGLPQPIALPPDHRRFWGRNLYQEVWRLRRVPPLLQGVGPRVQFPDTNLA